MKEQTEQTIILIILTALAIAILWASCGCATPAMKASWEQISADARAGEIQDVIQIADAATDKWGRANYRITAETTQRTLNLIHEERTLPQWATGVLDFFLDGGVGTGTGFGGLGAMLTALLGFYLRQRRKTKIVERDREDLVTAISQVGDDKVKKAVAKLQAQKQPLNQVVREVESRIKNGSLEGSK